MNFSGWVPNIMGHLSFSLIGRLNQPGQSQPANFVPAWRQPVGTWRPRIILCHQERNLSDNLFFKAIETPWTGTHKLHFSMVADTAALGADRVGRLRGWIFVHRFKPPA